MKVHGFLVRFLLLVLLGAATGVACSQERKKPKITTSSNAQTVYKPLEIKETADKVKPQRLKMCSLCRQGRILKQLQEKRILLL